MKAKKTCICCGKKIDSLRIDSKFCSANCTRDYSAVKVLLEKGGVENDWLNAEGLTEESKQRVKQFLANERKRISKNAKD